MNEQQHRDAKDLRSPGNGTTEVRAVIDRFVDGVHAVLLVGSEESELIVPRATLPANATEGTWLSVQLDGQQLVSAIVDVSGTEAAGHRVASKLDLLRRRGSRLAKADGADGINETDG